jgi:hypothetical protein
MGRTSIGDRNLMRGFLAFLFIGLVALGAGAVGYNIGVSQTAATTAAASGTAVVYAGGWHLGGLLLLPFAFFLVPLFFMAFFGFLAFVFGPRRRFAGHGYGPMGGGPGGWDGRRAWVAEQHRRLHEEEARSASPSGPTGSPSTTSGGPVAG